jgi:hypothetical protein
MAQSPHNHSTSAKSCQFNANHACPIMNIIFTATNDFQAWPKPLMPQKRPPNLTNIGLCTHLLTYFHNATSAPARQPDDEKHGCTFKAHFKQCT